MAEVCFAYPVVSGTLYIYYLQVVGLSALTHPHIEASLKLSGGTELGSELLLLQSENLVFY